MSLSAQSGQAIPAALCIGVLAACSTAHPLVDTPNLYIDGGNFPPTEVPESQRSNKIDILYVTDRAPEVARDTQIRYGAERSASMAFGSTIVRIGDDLTWDELVEASRAGTRKQQLLLKTESTRELGRFPETPLPFSIVDGRIVEQSDIRARYDQTAQSLRREIVSRLTVSNEKEIVLFIHGFNSDFESSAFAISDIWHFTGHQGVPILYTWPAGSGGLFGYFTDRESGEFTVFHLKEFLRLIASIPDVERVHIIAHSRGTDVTTTALRELVIESRAAGRDPRKDLRIENLVLAAPDLDFDVVRQRLIAEKFGPAIGQITVYTNQSDSALGLSQRLMAGIRFGRLETGDVGEREIEIFARVKNVNFVNVKGVNGLVGHNYFREHPGTLSDIVIVIRDRSRPGDPNRPLVHRVSNFWDLPKNYPRQE